ncbi:MAG: beta-N-acetylglucosaminidase domain-containing protein [Spongiibacter sp.]|nr:beta-N-acetylglucosaminidase domain-containing protein [Spongiibacter sp.]
MSFHLGVIEGFYGRQWSWAQRLSLPPLLKSWGYRSYLYAPKGDTSLRSQWRTPFTPVQRENLAALAKACCETGIEWGLGLSPVGLQADYREGDRDALRQKLDEIKALSPNRLWILFDDLPAGNPHLATNQLAVVDTVRHHCPELQLAVCPSYYSDDPILEELFGACPQGYFADLSDGLSAEIDLLWTGSRVISEAYSEQDMRAAADKLGRLPLLWDNYPVNDGRRSSRFLNVSPFQGRPTALSRLCSGHYVNPMNQFHLSLPVLQDLPKVYTAQAESFDERLASALASLPSALADLLQRHWQDFQRRGLDGMSGAEKQVLAARCDEIAHPAAVELATWLREGYRFDPECLTE